MRIGIVGCGSIGVAFAVLFADAGHDVACWDPYEDARLRARRDVEDRAVRLAEHHLLRDEVHVLLARVTIGADLEEAVRQADFVQECAPEVLELKQDLYARLSELTGSHLPLASASSAITASSLSIGCPSADRILSATQATRRTSCPVDALTLRAWSAGADLSTVQTPPREVGESVAVFIAFRFLDRRDLGCVGISLSVALVLIAL